MKIYSVFMVLVILLAQECNHHKGEKDGDHSEKTEERVDLEKKRVFIELKKNPCFGGCPIYALKIYTDGFAEFEGKRFTNKLGKFTKQLPKSTVEELVKEFNAVGFMEMDNLYPGKVPDLPKTNIIYYPNVNTKKEVTGDDYRPENLLALDKKLVDIAMTEDWTLIEKSPHSDELPKYVIKNEIIAKFDKKIDIPDYIRSQSAYKLDIVKNLSRSQGIWLLTYDTTKISPAQMLIKLKEAPEIEEAEFNKNLSNRRE